VLRRAKFGLGEPARSVLNLIVIPGDAKHRARNLEIPGLVVRTIPGNDDLS
jgi:hypothetical protein